MLRCMVLALALIAAVPRASSAQSSDAAGGLDCADFELVGATILQGMPTSYTLSGLCRFEDDGTNDAGTPQSVLGLATIEATWDQAAGQATEKITFDGGLAGSFSSSFQCTQDPFVYETPCQLTQITNETAWPTIDQSLRQTGQPLMSQRVNLDEALAVAARGPVGRSAGPPSLGGPKPLLGSSIKDSMARQGQGVLEGESLVANASSQGRLAILRTRPGESAWSNDAQLYWQPDAIGSLLTIPLNTTRPGEYLARIYLSLGPDHGLARLYIRYRQSEGEPGTPPRFGETEALEVDGYAPQLMPPQPVEMRVPFTDGSMQLIVSVPGANPSSSGLAVGIDRIELGSVLADMAP